MRPLPRVFAVTDTTVCRLSDFAIRAAAIASAGSAVALVVRAPEATAREQLATLDRVRALARPAQAAVFGHGDPAAARAGLADGVQLRLSDLSPADARRAFPRGWVGVSVHEPDEARQAFEEGADYVIAGNLYPSPSHPGRAGRGLAWLTDIVSLGKPVVAIGGITLERIPDIQAAGAWGVAAMSAFWGADDPAGVTARFVEAIAP